MGSIAAVDTMIFIYLFEDDARFIDQVYPLFKKAESGKNTLITSIISVAEALASRKYLDDKITSMNIEQFFRETQGLTVYPVNWDIALEAALLRQKYRELNMPDAIQIATAIIHEADVFLTNDLKLKHLSIPRLSIQTLS